MKTPGVRDKRQQF